MGVRDWVVVCGMRWLVCSAVGSGGGGVALIVGRGWF